MVNKDVKNQLNLLSVQYGDKKFVLETTNNGSTKIIRI